MCSTLADKLELHFGERYSLYCFSDLQTRPFPYSQKWNFTHYQELKNVVAINKFGWHWRSCLAQGSWLVEFHSLIVCGMDDVANLTIVFVKQPDFLSCLTPAHHNFRLCTCTFTIGAWSCIKLVSGLWCIWKFNSFNTSCCCNDETFKRHICLPVSMYIWINIS